MSFSSLLIQSCTIQSKALTLSGYEKVEGWTTVASGVPTRKDAVPVKIADAEIRVNSDDDFFFFKADVTIERGNRILLDGLYYDVIDVNKIYNRKTLHHLEVIGRITDHD